MKPRVYKSQGLWICRTSGHRGQAFTTWGQAVKYALKTLPEAPC